MTVSPDGVPLIVLRATYSGSGLSGLPGGGTLMISSNIIGTTTLPAFFTLSARRTSLLSATEASRRIFPISATSPGGWGTTAAGVLPPIVPTPGASGATSAGHALS